MAELSAYDVQHVKSQRDSLMSQGAEVGQSIVSGVFFFFQAEDGIRDVAVTGVQTCALPILEHLGISLAESEHGGVRIPRGDAGEALQLRAIRRRDGGVAVGVVCERHVHGGEDRKRVVLGKRVDLGGGRIIKKKKIIVVDEYI